LDFVDQKKQKKTKNSCNFKRANFDMAAQAPFEKIGQAFLKEYYSRFDKDRKALLPLYSAKSMLTFEGGKVMGAQKIVAKLSSLSAGKIAHQIVKYDCQPTAGNGVLVFVVGNVKIDNDNPIKFSQVFTLLPSPTQKGNYYCHNDIFRLNYC
jgi:Nuclear transport factor 2 (NTF2) domain